MCLKSFFSYEFIGFSAARCCWSCQQCYAFKVLILHKKSTHQRLVISLHVKGFLIIVIQMPDCILTVHYKKSCDIFVTHLAKVHQ